LVVAAEEHQDLHHLVLTLVDKTVQEDLVVLVVEQEEILVLLVLLDKEFNQLNQEILVLMDLVIQEELLQVYLGLQLQVGVVQVLQEEMETVVDLHQITVLVQEV
jgi:hypothetical protein